MVSDFGSYLVVTLGLLNFLDSNIFCDAQKGIGALYFQTNDKNNRVIINRILRGGRLEFIGDVPTQGEGGGTRGVMHSANSVIVEDNFLFVVNCVSSTISTFEIDRNDPTRLQFLNQIPSAGDFPTSIAYDCDTKRACVLNAGKKSGVACFELKQLGLEATPNSKLVPFPPNTEKFPKPLPTQDDRGIGKGTVSAIIFVSSTLLLVTLKALEGPDVRGYVYGIPIDQNGFLGTPTINRIGIGPYSIDLHPERENFVGFTDPGIGWTLAKVDKVGKIKRFYNTDVPENLNTCWSAWSNNSKNFFTIDAFSQLNTGIVSEFKVSVCKKVKISLLQQITLEPILNEARIASFEAQDYLYVIYANNISTDGHNGVWALDVTKSGEGHLIQQHKINDVPNSLYGLGVYVPA